MKIVKILAWLNPTKIQIRPRIDMEVSYADGTRKRYTRLTIDQYREITEVFVSTYPEAWERWNGGNQEGKGVIGMEKKEKED